MRVYEFAKRNKLSSQQVMRIIREHFLSIQVENHFSDLTEEEVLRIKQFLLRDPDLEAKRQSRKLKQSENTQEQTNSQTSNIETTELVYEVAKQLRLSVRKLIKIIQETPSLNIQITDRFSPLLEKEILRIKQHIQPPQSPKKNSQQFSSWERIAQIFEKNENIYGLIIKQVRDGFLVDINLPRIIAFLPNSQVEFLYLRKSKDFSKLGFDFKILNINKQRESIILSRRALFKEERKIFKREIIKSLKEGAIVSGIVNNIRKYGAFIDLGGIDGLLHIADMSWGRINHPSDILSIGDELRVKVLKFNRETEHISLGLKQLLPDPWAEALKRYPIGIKVTGRIISLIDYGAFVELEEGIEGLLHVSEMSWTKRIKNSSKVLSKGDIINCVVLRLNNESKKIFLGVKQLEPNPWEILHETYPIGSKITGKIHNITDFGIFIKLQEGINALVHISNFSWTTKIKHPNEIYSKNQEIEAIVLDIDSVRERFSLGIKQLLPDPWIKAFKQYPIGTQVTGRVVSLIDYGAFVELEKGIEGLLHISEMSWTKRIKNLSEVLSKGDIINCVILKHDNEGKKISLGVKQLEPNPWEILHETYPVGTRILGKIRNITNFGIFIGIEEGIDGLVHISDLSWTQRIKHPNEVYTKGQELEAVVLSIDVANERFSLGIKQLSSDPWDSIPERYPPGHITEARITKLTDFGAFAEIEEGIEGLIHISELSLEHVENPNDVVKQDQNVRVEVISVDPRDRKIALSIKSYLRRNEAGNLREFDDLGSSVFGGQLAEALGKKR